MIHNIYLITNIENKKQYVGITKFTIKERFLQHTRRGFLLTEAINKYGEEKFSVDLIEEVESIAIAYEFEQYYIKQYNTKVPNGYNLTDGGDGAYGWIISDEDRKRRSKVMKRLHKEKKTGMHGKTHSEDTKKKMSDVTKGKPKPWLIGKERSEETRKKISRGNIGKINSAETREKISQNHHDISGKNNPMYGKKHSPETIEKLREKAKNRLKRIWINNGVEEKLIPVDEQIPIGYNKGRVRF